MEPNHTNIPLRILTITRGQGNTQVKIHEVISQVKGTRVKVTRTNFVKLVISCKTCDCHAQY